LNALITLQHSLGHASFYRSHFKNVNVNVNGLLFHMTQPTRMVCKKHVNNFKFVIIAQTTYRQSLYVRKVKMKFQEVFHIL